MYLSRAVAFWVLAFCSARYPPSPANNTEQIRESIEGKVIVNCVYMYVCNLCMIIYPSSELRVLAVELNFVYI